VRFLELFFRWSTRRDDSPRNRFSVTAQDVLAREKAAARSPPRSRRWYHSHPDHPARPSEYEPRITPGRGYKLIIVMRPERAPQDMTSWRFEKRRRAEFSPEGIDIRHRAAVQNLVVAGL